MSCRCCLNLDDPLDNPGTEGVIDDLGPPGALEGNWMIRACGNLPPCDADTDGNGTVNVLDLLAVILAWGDCP